MDKQLYDLMTEADDVLKGVMKNIDGRSADLNPGFFNTRLLAALSVMAGDGDTLEIGVFFGVSFITATLLRSKHKLIGDCYALDPLDGRKQDRGEQRTGMDYDAPSGKVWNAEVFQNNCERNKVKPVLVQRMSHPFPKELSANRFVISYIDGDHWHNTPTHDWLNVKDRTDRFIVFDDADNKHPHVIDAVNLAKQSDEWRVFYQAETITAFERVE